MTATTTASARDFTSRYGSSAVDCGGAHIRAHCRHAATVVAISGRLDGDSRDQVTDCVRRFILADKHFVLDLSGVDSFAAKAIPILFDLGDACLTGEVEWALIASEAVSERLRVGNFEALFPIVDSVPEALHRFTDAIEARRRLLLPLLSKTA